MGTHIHRWDTYSGVTHIQRWKTSRVITRVGTHTHILRWNTHTECNTHTELDTHSEEDIDPKVNTSRVQHKLLVVHMNRVKYSNSYGGLKAQIVAPPARARIKARSALIF